MLEIASRACLFGTLPSIECTVKTWYFSHQERSYWISLHAIGDTPPRRPLATETWLGTWPKKRIARMVAPYFLLCWWLRPPMGGEREKGTLQCRMERIRRGVKNKKRTCTSWRELHVPFVLVIDSAKAQPRRNTTDFHRESQWWPRIDVYL